MSNKKRGLGRGLSALINDDFNLEEGEDTIKDIEIKLIQANKDQPRREFKEESLLELSKSIKENGIIQPIIIRKKGRKYELIAGERRLRAAEMAGLKSVPSIVKDIDDGKSAKFALIENIQREDLNPIEEAKAYRSIMDKYNISQEELSKEVGKSRSYISNTLRLLNLDNEILDYILEGKLSQGHGKALLSLKDSVIQKKIAIEIMERELSVRDTENLIREMSEKKDKKKAPRERESHIIALEESLMSSLGTKVRLKGTDKKGKIEIEYYSLDDLDRILEILKK